jgi:hypothetical protein
MGQIHLHNTIINCIACIKNKTKKDKVSARENKKNPVL